MAEIQRMMDRAMAVAPTWQVSRRGDALTITFDRPWWKGGAYTKTLSRDETIVFWQMLAKVSRATMIREPLEEMQTEQQEFLADLKRALRTVMQETGPLYAPMESLRTEWGDGTLFNDDAVRQFVARVFATHDEEARRATVFVDGAVEKAAALMVEKGYRKY